MLDVKEASAEQEHELRRVTLTPFGLGKLRTILGHLQLRYVKHLDVLKILQGKRSAGVL
jgi:hypothetical protein